MPSESASHASDGVRPPAGPVEQLSGAPLTGDRLQAALAVLPPAIAAQHPTVIGLTLPSAREVDDPHAWWSTSMCVDGHDTMFFGHEDPVTMTSVYDGSVSLSLEC